MVEHVMTIEERAGALVDLLMEQVSVTHGQVAGVAYVRYDRALLVKLAGEALLDGRSDATFDQWRALVAENVRLRAAVDAMAEGAVTMAHEGAAAREIVMSAGRVRALLNRDLTRERAARIINEIGFLGIVDLVAIVAESMDGSIEAVGPRFIVKIKKRPARVKSKTKAVEYCQASACRERVVKSSEFCAEHQELARS